MEWGCDKFSLGLPHFNAPNSEQQAAYKQQISDELHRGSHVHLHGEADTTDTGKPHARPTSRCLPESVILHTRGGSKGQHQVLH